tara:strand:+ start:4414 stop:5853 length:1440 start_codon:yes stop_codon:yes gene_type:complete
MEEEQYGNSYGERLSQTYSLIGDKLRENPITNTLLALTGTSLGSTKLRPGLIGSATEGQMIKQGTANLRNPAYRNLLGKSIVRQGAKVGGIPTTTALIAGDVVTTEADKVQGEMQRLSDIEGSQIQKAGGDVAERLRRLNIIEEARAAELGTSPFGGEEGITMGNLDAYFAANPEFSGIGDVTLPGEEPRVAPVVQQTPVAPTMEGIDYSSAFAGDQPTASTASTAPMASMASPGFRPQFEGQTLGQFLRYEDAPEQATMQALDPQGRLRQFTAGGQLAPNLAAFEAASAAREARIGAPKVGLGTAVQDTATGELSMTDYRNLAEEELGTGAPSQAITARAKQLMGIQQAKEAATELASELTQAQTEKAKRPPQTRAPSSAELGLAINQKMAALQAKIDAGQELTPEELIDYRAGNSYIQMQSKFGESPFQMPGDNENNSLPSATDPKGKELIAKMKKQYPDSSEEDIIKSLRSAKRIS